MSKYQEYIERKIEEHSQDKLVEAGIVLIENVREIKTLEALCTQFCCLTACKNCPVHIHNYDKRTEYEKCSLHEPCVVNLFKWVKEEALRMEVDCVPTVEATPIKYGHIIETVKDGKMNRVFSCCDTDFTKLTTWLIPKYCPNCGAKISK